MSTVPFIESKFNDLLNGAQAWQALYYRSSLCPCRNRGNGSPSTACLNCKGYGYTWSTPGVSQREEIFYYGSQKKPARLGSFVKTSDIVSVVGESNNSFTVTINQGLLEFSPTPNHGEALTVVYNSVSTITGSITSLMSRKEWATIGEVDHRDLQLTVDRYLADGTLNPAWDASEHDRFLVPEGKMRVQTTNYKGETDRLRYSYVYGLERIYSLNKQTYAPIDYLPVTHYTLVNGAIVWVSGQGPKAGEPYAVIYSAAPEFYVYKDLPQMRHQGDKPLPRRMALRLWELYPNASAS